MLVSTKHKALILNSRNPERIKKVIPKVKQFEYRGTPLLALPHVVEVVRILRNLGIDAPAPISYYYEWAGMYAPYMEQHETAAMLSQHNRAYCLNSMGTGKTLASLWAYDYLRSQGIVKRLLVVAPLSTLERTWGDTVFEHFPDLRCVSLYGAASKRRKLLAKPADIYVVNHHGLAILQDDLKQRPDIDLVIYDELSVVKNSKTSLWKAANHVINGPILRKAWGLTGTPMSDSPLDVWGQVKLITPWQAQGRFSQFREQIMFPSGPFSWIPRKGYLDVLHRMMQPAVRFTLEECVDLPEQVFIERHAPLTPEQNKAFKDMIGKLRAEYAAGEILAVNEAVKVGKLLQISAGVAYDIHGKEVLLPSGPRLSALEELIDESEGSVIVFVAFSGVLRSVVEFLSRRYSTAFIDGGVKKYDRDRIFGEFQKNGFKVLVAQPKTMSHGLTLTAATTIVWYGPITSNETFEQANARIRRPGQKKTTVVAALTGTPLERKLFNRLRTKQNTQGQLLDLFKTHEEEL